MVSEIESMRAVGPAKGANVWLRWVSEIRYTWVLVVLVVTVPTVIFGSSALSGIVLTATVVLGLPTVVAAFLLTKDRAWNFRLWRRMVVMGTVSAVSLSVVLQTDKLTPGMATSIVQAIEQHKNETGAYPRTLVELSPKYLVELPMVRAAISQPEISYLVRDGRPRLVIPSAAGDAFANYRHGYLSQLWHNDGSKSYV
jgi:hypothetical protein